MKETVQLEREAAVKAQETENEIQIEKRQRNFRHRDEVLNQIKDKEEAYRQSRNELQKSHKRELKEYEDYMHLLDIEKAQKVFLEINNS